MHVIFLIILNWSIQMIWTLFKLLINNGNVATEMQYSTFNLFSPKQLFKWCPISCFFFCHSCLTIWKCFCFKRVHVIIVLIHHQHVNSHRQMHQRKKKAPTPQLLQPSTTKSQHTPSSRCWSYCVMKLWVHCYTMNYREL